MAQIGIVAKYNFYNYFRSRRFYVMLAIVLLISGLLTAAIGYFRPPGILLDPLAFYGAGWGSFASFVVILATAFFGGDAISGEFQNRTGYFLVPNPMRRSAVYVGKWIAALTASAITLAAYALIMVANGLYYFGASIPWQFEQSFLFALIYLIAALSLAFAFSSLFKSSAISVLMSVIMLLFVFNVIDTVASTVAGIEPWFSITYGSGIVTSVLSTNFQHVTTVGGDRFQITMYNAYTWEGLLILTGYFVVTAIIGLWLFERKEFTS